MTTIYTHAVAGLGLGKVCEARRLPWWFWGLCGFLPILPDFDAFWDVPYGSPYGHRGFTHSLAVAAFIGLLSAWPVYRKLQMRFGRLWLLFFGIVGSHGLLDAFTDGGYGVALFWPLSDRRFGPWGPIRVADIGFEIPNPFQSLALQSELRWVWLPTILIVGTVIWYRLSKRRGAATTS